MEAKGKEPLLFINISRKPCGLLFKAIYMLFNIPLLFPRVAICDATETVLVTNKEAIKTRNLKPFDSVLDYMLYWVLIPTIVDIGPAPTIKQLLHKQGQL